MNTWMKRRLGFITACLAVVALPVVALAGAGAELSRAIAGGVLLGSALLIAGFAGAEIFAPLPFLNWRAWMMEDEPSLGQRIANPLDRALGPTQVSQAKTIRRVGLLLLGSGTLVELIVWWFLHSLKVL